jgi:predicted dehydrogenase
LQAYYSLCGFFDSNAETAREVSDSLGIPAYDSFDALLDAVEAVDIVTPTTTHFDLAKKAIERGKHVFIEKPVTETPAEAQTLIAWSKKFDVVVQVGHVERFNPAMLAVRHIPLNPMFVEAHRLANFNPRGTDVPVVLDLMIHDIDIVLSLVKSPVKNISASGVAVVSETPDIANARIEFENGCVANLTASRISIKQMRKVRLFQKDAYLGLDFLEKNAQVLRMTAFEGGEIPPHAFELETPQGTKVISMEIPPTEPVNAILEELRSFAGSILEGNPPVVSLEEGYEALRVAWAVMKEIEERLGSSKTKF